MKKVLFIFFLPLWVFLSSSSSYAADWSSCEYELDRAKKAARDSADIASDLESLESELSSLKDDYKSCIQFPDVYDLLDTGCESQRSEYNDKVEEYNSRISDLNSELSSFVSRAKSALSDCGD